MNCLRLFTKSFRSLLIFACLGALFPNVIAQELGAGASTLKTFQVLIDRDADPSTGFDSLMNDGVSIAAGVELLVTITVQSGPVPMVVMVQAQEWDGNNAFEPPYFTDASGWPVGTNNGTDASDVVEAYIPLERFGITQMVYLFTQSGQPGAAFDIVGRTPFHFGVPTPTLTQWMLFAFIALLMLSALWFMRRRRKKTPGLLALLVATALLGATCSIILDGQVDDWPAQIHVIDLVDDTTDNALDITTGFVCYDHQNLFFRLDVQDLENGIPMPDDQIVSLPEDSPTIITLTGSDPDGQSLIFMIQSPPSNGFVTSPTSTGPTSAELIYTPNADYVGDDSFQFWVNDQNGGIAIATVTITVEPVNDPPSFTAGNPISVSKDTGPQSFANWATNMSPGPANESGQNLTFIINITSNPDVFAVPPAIDATTGTLTFTPDADSNGPANLEITLMDDGGTANGGIDTSAPQTVTITIGTVNDAPTFTAGTDQINNEDAGAIVVNAWATAISPGPPDEAGQILTFNAAITSNPDDIFTVAPVLDATTGDLSYTLAPDAFGVATVSVTLMDDGGTANGGIDTSTPHLLTITVDPVNDAPSFTNTGNVNVFKGGGTETIPAWASALSAGPANENSQGFVGFSVQVTSDPNNVLGNLPTVDIATGNLTFDTTADNNGTATLSITLQDDGGIANGGMDTSAAAIIDIHVGAINDAPTFTAGADQTRNEDDGAIVVNAWATSISPGPPDEAGQMLTFNTAVSSDPGSIFAVAPAIDATTGNLSYTLAADAFGEATVSVTLMDDGGTANGGTDTSAPHLLTITVNAVNDAPSFTNAGNVNVFKGGGTETTPGWASALSLGPPNESSQSFTGFNVQITSDPNSVLGNTPTVDVATGNLSFNTSADNNGTATVSITLQDDGGAANGGVDTSAAAIIDINVGAVNDAPTFTAGADPIHDEDDGAIVLNAWATMISPGPPDEAGQMLTFNVAITSNPGNIFSVAPALDAMTGTLSYTLAANAFGVATLDVTLMDDGGTANGGVDTSATHSLTITVNPVNDPPVAVNDSYDTAINTRFEVGVSSGEPAHRIVGSVLTDGTADSDIDSPSLAVIGTANVPVGASLTMNADGSFIFIPPPGAIMGPLTFDYTLSDQHPTTPLTATATVTLNFFDFVWYVKNDHVGPSLGTSEDPFQTLAEAETAASTGDKIFVFTGDGTISGQNAGITLLANQSLLGEGVDLILDINGTPSTVVTGSGMLSNAPRIGNAGGDVVTLADDNTVAGVILLPTASAGLIGSTLPVGMKQGHAKTTTEHQQTYADRIAKAGKRAGGTTVIRDVLINPANASDGLVLIGQSGNFSFINSQITGLAGNTGDGLVIDSSSAVMTFDNLDISATHRGILVTNNTIAGGIPFTATNVFNCHDTALEILGESSDINYTTGSINQTTGGNAFFASQYQGTANISIPITVSNVDIGFVPVNIFGINENPTFNFGNITIEDSTEDAVRVDTLGPMSVVNFNGILDINDSAQAGMAIMNCFGEINVLNTATDIANANGPGFFAEDGAPRIVFNGTITNNLFAVFLSSFDPGSSSAFNGLLSQEGGTAGYFAFGLEGTHTVQQANFGTLANRITNGFFINDSPGTFTFENFQIFSSGTGFEIMGSNNPQVNVLTMGTQGLINSLNTAISHQAGTLTGTFTDIVANTNGSVNPGLLFDENGNVTLRNVDIDTDAGKGISALGIELTFDPAGTSTIDTVTGSAIELQGTGLGGTLDQVTVTAGTQTGILFDDTLGSLNLDTIDLTTIGAAGLRIAGNRISILNNASSINTTNASAIEGLSRAIGTNGINLGNVSVMITGGNTEGIDWNAMFDGTLHIANYQCTVTSGTSRGIVITAIPSTVQIDQATISTVSGFAVNATAGSPTAMYRFSNFDITTTGGSGLDIRNGGTVELTGTNTASTGTGTGVYIQDANIGANGVTFESVNTNGALNGIVLDNTGGAGFFSVTGDGTNLSGGTLTNSTGNAVSMHSTTAVTLNEMAITLSGTNHINATRVNGLTLNGTEMSQSDSHGISGNTITDLSMRNCLLDQSGDAILEYGLFITDLFGTSEIISSDFTLSASQHIFINMEEATQAAPMPPADILTLDDCSFTMPGPSMIFDENIEILVEDTANFRVIFDDAIGPNTIDGGMLGIHVLVTDMTATADIIARGVVTENQTRHGIFLVADSNTNMTFDLSGNTVQNFAGNGIWVISNQGSNSSGQLVGNVITNSTGGRGMDLSALSSGFLTALARNNQITNTFHSGITCINQGDGGSLNLTLDNNTAGSPTRAGIEILVDGNFITDAPMICLNMFDNTSTATGQFGFRLDKTGFPAAVFNLQDFTGMGNNLVDITNWVNTDKNNTGTITAAGPFAAPAMACPTP